MKQATVILLTLVSVIVISCSQQDERKSLKDTLAGTWQLISSETHTKDSVAKDKLEGKRMIKIITDSHFAFLSHDLHNGKDTATASFVSGGGACSFTDSTYTEHLEYCNYREWEGLAVTFHVQVHNDTLTLTGEESKNDIGVNQYIIEKYVKL